MNSLKFESVGDVSHTLYGNTQIGAQVGELTKGVAATYCATSNDMGFVNFQMSVTYEEA